MGDEGLHILTFAPLVSPRTPQFDQKICLQLQNSETTTAIDYMPDKRVKPVDEAKADVTANDQVAADVRREMSNASISTKMKEGGSLQRNIPIIDLSNQRYVNLLQERIRELEEKHAQSVSEQRSSPQVGTISNQGSTEQRPLSPASLSDGVLDLDNSGAFELLEFGTSNRIGLT